MVITVNAFVWLALLLGCYFSAIYIVCRMTIRNIRPKYPSSTLKVAQNSIQETCLDQYAKICNAHGGSSRWKEMRRKEGVHEGKRANRIVRISLLVKAPLQNDVNH